MKKEIIEILDKGLILYRNDEEAEYDVAKIVADQILELFEEEKEKWLEEGLPKGFDTEGTLLDVYREQYEDGFNACLSEIKKRLLK